MQINVHQVGVTNQCQVIRLVIRALIFVTFSASKRKDVPMNKLTVASTLLSLTLMACSTTNKLPDSTQNPAKQGITVQNWTASVVNGQTVLKNNNSVQTLKGINWFGLDSQQQMGGVWTNHVQNGVTKNHDLDFWFTKIKALGFNAIRIPLSADTIWLNHTGSNTMLNTVIQKANQYNMYVVLGYQTCSPNYLGKNLVGDPSRCPDRAWNLSSWLYYINRLANLAKNNPNVVAIDLFNEPHQLNWTTWKSYAEQAVNEAEKVYAPLAERNILYFVEGSGGLPNWGADISQAATPAGRLFLGGGVKDQIVYSPHFYGKWVNASTAAQIVNNVVNSGAPVVIGEFGIVQSTDPNAVGGTAWGTTFITGVKTASPSFFYWAWNANEYDGPYGLLRHESTNGNWCTLESAIITTIRDNYSFTIPATTPLNTVCY